MKKFGLALGSGGPKGFYHLGVLKCLEDNNIHIDYLTGASIGALAGGIYLSNNSAKTTEEKIKNLTKKEYALMFANLTKLPTKGLIKGEKLIQVLDNLTNNKSIEELPIPFVVMSTDLNTGKSVKITKGKLSHAIRASSSIPFVFQPYKINEYNLVDGGLSCPLPTTPLKELGAEVVLAINLHNPKNIDKINLKTIFTNTIQIALFNLAKEQMQDADILLSPQIKDDSWLNIIKPQSLIDQGYSDTKVIIPRLKQLLS